MLKSPLSRKRKKKMNKKAVVVGAGLAGCEAAYQLSKRGVKVDLYEMRPYHHSPAHSTDLFAELVCSNSLRADGLQNAVGLLKAEMRRLDSLIMSAADATRVPAGGALAVDRLKFSQTITDRIKSDYNINVINAEITQIPDEKCVIIATGPLTSSTLSESISKIIGVKYLYFFDAAAPIVTFDSIDMDKAFFASRYDKGTADYINCPMTKEQYDLFYDQLINAECAQLHDFENKNVFEGCMPVEVMALRGHDTLLFGPLKPVGLVDKRTNERPYAVVQLRKDNAAGTLYNMVGFQTHLKFSEQKRVFSLIPGLESCEIVRFGVMHRNTYLHSPGLLNEQYGMINREGIYFAGQITGVEGYVESAASGLAAGINAARKLCGLSEISFTADTAIGALAKHISCGTESGNFQPMNINFGIINPLDVRIKNKAERYNAISLRALKKLDEIINQNNL